MLPYVPPCPPHRRKERVNLLMLDWTGLEGSWIYPKLSKTFPIVILHFPENVIPIRGRFAFTIWNFFEVV